MSWEPSAGAGWGGPAATGAPIAAWNPQNEAGASGDWGSGPASGDTWNAGTSNDPVSNVSKHEDGAFGGDKDDACRNCGQPGHFARDCPEPRKSSGNCFNCGQPGHSKAECTNPRVFTGTCRICSKEGHPASECPDKAPDICKNCQQEGHKAAECKSNRVLDLSKIASKSPEEAWDLLKAAAAEGDLDDFREAVKVYSKAVPDTTYAQLERSFRDNNFKIYLIAIEKEIPGTFTIVDLQGKIDCKYCVGYYKSARPRRQAAAQGWPASPEENLDRLKDAGIPMDRGVPRCNNCNELGHTAKFCKEEKQEIERVAVNCVNCGEIGHRARDCPQERVDRFACRNCKKSGHNAADCPEPRSAEGVECRRCNETGHFSKDCPNNSGGRACRNCGEEGHISKECDKPKNPANSTCRNCEQVGHFSRDCPQPKDWSKVKCSQCGEMGHTIRRCPQVPADSGVGEENKDVGEPSGADNWTNPAGAATSDDWNKPAGLPDWAKGAAPPAPSTSAPGW